MPCSKDRGSVLWGLETDLFSHRTSSRPNQELAESPNSGASRERAPRAKIFENESRWVLELESSDLAGLQVATRSGHLVLEEESSAKEFVELPSLRVSSERNRNSTRRFRLPEDADLEQIEIAYLPPFGGSGRGPTLKVVVPKKEHEPNPNRAG